MAKRKGRNGGELWTWEPGQSGNPKGSKPGYKHARTILKKLLALQIHAQHPITKEMTDISLGEALHLRQIQMALASGDTMAYREIMDRIEGKPTQPLEHTGKDGDPIEVKTWVIEIPAEPTTYPYGTTDGKANNQT